MKYFLTLLTFFFINTPIHDGNIEIYKIPFESKLKTKAAVEVIIDYEDTSKVPDEKKIHQLAQEILKEYTTIEIYATKRIEITETVQKAIFEKFKNTEYKITRVVFADVMVSEEIKILCKKLSDLDTNFMWVQVDIGNRIEEIKKELETNKKLAKKEKAALEKELFVLDNSNYIDKIYSKRLTPLLRD